MDDKQYSELKLQIEALLFSSGKSMSLDEIGRICRVNDPSLLKKLLEELKDGYNSKNSSLMVIDERDSAFWKLAVREKQLSIVKKVVSKAELTKTLMETLAIIAYKAPVKQSDVIKVRTNKAYDHIAELVDLGYITTEKFGRTRLIKLGSRFFDYFDIPPDKLKEKFGKFEVVEKAISEKENENTEKEQRLMQVNKEAASEDQKIEQVISELETLPVVKDEKTDVVPVAEKEFLPAVEEPKKDLGKKEKV